MLYPCLCTSSLQADVFSYGLLLCQLIADVSYDPEELPRSPDFGLAREAFTKMVAEQSLGDGATRDPPPDDLLQLAFDCCSVSVVMQLRLDGAERCFAKMVSIEVSVFQNRSSWN